MKKKTKKICLGLLVPAISIPVVAICSYNSGISYINKNNDHHNSIYGNEDIKYLFNNKYYDSLDNITNELVNNNQYINSKLYYGNAKDAIFDHETKRVNVNQLREMDNSKISSAYLNAFGAHEQDFNKAKKSFVNEGLVKYKYQDTNGKLHSSFSEAKREILKGVKVDEAVFNKVIDNNGKEYKINPLNEDDINLMKSLAIKGAKANWNNPNHPFGIKPMIKEGENFTTLKNKDSLLGQMFSNQTVDNLFKTFYEGTNEIKGLKQIYNEAINLIKKETKFKANVEFKYVKGKENYVYAPDLSFDIIEKDLDTSNIKINRVNGPIKNNKKVTSIDFSNVSYNELNDFNVFLGQEYWNKPLSNNSKVTHSFQSAGGGHIADNMHFNKFLNKHSFGIYTNGHVGLDLWENDVFTGTNVGILYNKTWHNAQLYFDVKFSLQDEKQFISNLDNEVFKNLKQKFANDNSMASEAEKNLNNELIKNLVPLFREKVNFSDYFNLKYSNHQGIKSIKSLDNIFSDIVAKLISDESKNNFLTGFIKQIKKIYDNNVYIADINFDHKYNISHFLTYNNAPIFQITPSILLGEMKIDKNYIFYSWYLSNTIFNSNPTNPNFNYGNFKNISNFSSVDGQDIIFEKQFALIEMKDGYFKIPEEIKEYQGQLNNMASEPLKGNQNGIYYALNSYNQNLNYLNKKYSNNLPEEIKNKLINNTEKIRENILVLRNKRNNNLTIESYFSKFISLLYDFNESLFSKETLIYDKNTLQTSIEASNSIDPAKVIVIYDLSGNVVNPGISISDDLVMQTTSDAMYDSERTILDNIYRTLIVKKDPNKVFYKNNDGTHTLLDYQSNFIFTLSYNKKEHNFLTYNDAWLYLRDIISLDAQKVNIKGDKNEIN
ncbi:MAG: hypothetical protein ACRCRP_03280 [Metamycoplasmataceae bacterium]